MQLEFEVIRRAFAGCVAVLRRRRTPPRQTSAMEYTLKLSAALRVHNLTHQLHDVLCAVAKLEAKDGHATKSGIALALACTYHNVVKHIERNPDLFDLVPGEAKPTRYCLSAEGLRLLGKVQTRVHRS